MQIIDANGNMFGRGSLEVIGANGKPKVPSSAATLIVNSTPITGGTVGRILFEGTGNVLQQSSSMSFNSSIGALTIATAMSNNTNAPLVVQNLTAYSNPFNQYIQLWKNSVGANILSLRADGSFDLAGSVNTSTVQLGTNGNGTSLLSLYRLNAGFWFPSGTMIGITTSSLERMRITDIGNVLIGTTTDSGYKLDVNGSTRIGGVASGSAALHLKGQSGYGQYLYFDNGTGNGLWTMVGGTVFAFDSATTRIWRISPSAQVTINGNTNIGCAQLQVDSTTRGFLPPRMTTAEKTGITSLVAGLVVYDTTLQALCSYNGASWITQQENLFDFYTKRGILIFDDMWYGQSSASFINNNLLWGFSGGSQIVQSNSFFGLVPTTTQRGVTLWRTQTSPTSFVNFVVGQYSSVPSNTIFYLANGKINYETYVLFPLLSDATERFYFHFGFTNNSTSLNPQEYVGIVYNEGTTFGYDNNLGGSPNFTFNNASSSTRTRTIGSSAVAINTWYKLRIEVLCDTSVINFYVNDVLVATHTTNIPAAATRVQPFMNFTKTIGTTNREVAVDYVAIKQDFTTIR
jgi:hypothetical protein